MQCLFLRNSTIDSIDYPDVGCRRNPASESAHAHVGRRISNTRSMRLPVFLADMNDFGKNSLQEIISWRLKKRKTLDFEKGIY